MWAERAAGVAQDAGEAFGLGGEDLAAEAREAIGAAAAGVVVIAGQLLDETGGEELPASADEVQFVVLPFGTPPSRLSLLADLPRLRVIQLMSAGAEHVLGYVPPGVTLCTARGAHDPAVAEWIMAVILSQQRLLPGFMAAQQAGTWKAAISRFSRPTAMR